ncbi:MAG: secretion system protein E, partial [Gammaproteobacteria bacterium]|nr:secretion system protein E [Gammaproteobacteria bacterium]
MTPRRETNYIGQILVEKGIVSQDQVDIALTEQKKTNRHLGKTLVALGFATEAVIRDVLSGVLGQESVDLNRVVLDSDAIKLIPQDVARRHNLL